MTPSTNLTIEVRAHLADRSGGPPTETSEAPWVVLVSDVPLVPGSHGSQTRVRAMVQALRQAGYRVGFVLWERWNFLTPEDVAQMEQLVDELLIAGYPSYAQDKPPDLARVPRLGLVDCNGRHEEHPFSFFGHVADRVRNSDKVNRLLKTSRIPTLRNGLRTLWSKVRNSYKVNRLWNVCSWALPHVFWRRMRASSLYQATAAKGYEAWDTVGLWTWKEHDPREWYPERVRQALDLMLRSRPMAGVIAVYVYLAQGLPAARAHGILTLVDTVDVFHRMRAFFRKKLMRPTWFITNRETEAQLLDQADRVIAIQPREEELLRQMVDPRKVMRIEHSVPEACAITGTADDSRAVVLVGSDNPWNVDGLRWFLREVWPRVRDVEPEASLHVYGNLAHAVPWQGPGVHAHGFVDDVATAYRQGWVVINPVRLGTGLKIKTVEAMAHGRAVVATPTGAEGLEEAWGSALTICKDAASFAAGVAQLLGSPGEARKRGERAQEYARGRFASQAVFSPLLRDLALAQPHWNYQVAQAGGAVAVRRPELPTPALQQPWQQAWLDLSAGYRSEVAASVREAVARAARIDVELWVPQPHRGVAGHQALQHARALADLGFSVRLRGPRSWAEGLSVPESRCEVDVLEGCTSAPSSPVHLVHLISPDLATTLPLQKELLRWGKPWVHTCQSIDKDQLATLANEQRGWVAYLLWKANRVCFTSEHDRKMTYVLLGLNGVNSCTVWNGVNAAEPPSPAASNGCNGSHKKGTAFTWLWERSPERHHRPDVLLQAVRAVLSQGLSRPIRVLAPGSGSKNLELINQIQKLGLEQVVLPVDDAEGERALHEPADGYLLTSDAQGLPIGAVQAMARSLPIVCTAAGGLPEVLRQDQDAVLCACGDAQAVARGIRWVVENPDWAKALGRRAGAVARDALTLEEMTLRYALVYLDWLTL